MSLLYIIRRVEMGDNVGARGVNETAERMNCNKSYVTNTTRNMFRRLRWFNRLRTVTRFLNEYSKKSS